MREFKFRAWDISIPTYEEAIMEKEPSGMMIEWDYVKKSSYFKDGLDGKIPLMQYTSLKDKNGKEIYEGDIINIAGNHRKIYFEHGCFWVEHNGELHLHVFGEKLQYEIIGNIYENPELLEVS